MATKKETRSSSGTMYEAHMRFGKMPARPSVKIASHPLFLPQDTTIPMMTYIDTGLTITKIPDKGCVRIFPTESSILNRRVVCETRTITETGFVKLYLYSFSGEVSYIPEGELIGELVCEPADASQVISKIYSIRAKEAAPNRRNGTIEAIEVEFYDNTTKKFVEKPEIKPFQYGLFTSTTDKYDEDGYYINQDFMLQPKIVNSNYTGTQSAVVIWSYKEDSSEDPIKNKKHVSSGLKKGDVFGQFEVRNFYQYADLSGFTPV